MITQRGRLLTMTMKILAQRLGEMESNRPKHHQYFTQYIMQQKPRGIEIRRIEQSHVTLIKNVYQSEKYTNQHIFEAYVPRRNQLASLGYVHQRIDGFPLKNTIINTTHQNILLLHKLIVALIIYYKYNIRCKHKWRRIEFSSYFSRYLVTISTGDKHRHVGQDFSQSRTSFPQPRKMVQKRRQWCLQVCLFPQLRKTFGTIYHQLMAVEASRSIPES